MNSTESDPSSLILFCLVVAWLLVEMTFAWYNDHQEKKKNKVFTPKIEPTSIPEPQTTPPPASMVPLDRNALDIFPYPPNIVEARNGWCRIDKAPFCLVYELKIKSYSSSMSVWKKEFETLEVMKRVGYCSASEFVRLGLAYLQDCRSEPLTPDRNASLLIRRRTLMLRGFIYGHYCPPGVFIWDEQTISLICSYVAYTCYSGIPVSRAKAIFLEKWGEKEEIESEWTEEEKQTLGMYLEWSEILLNNLSFDVIPWPWLELHAQILRTIGLSTDASSKLIDVCHAKALATFTVLRINSYVPNEYAQLEPWMIKYLDRGSPITTTNPENEQKT
jgi:hypothetical protein